MSISDEIEWNLKNGILIPVGRKRPAAIGRQRRYLLLTQSLDSDIQSRISGGDIQFANLEADFVHFQTVREISKDFFKQLKPPGNGVWEIRSYRIDPTIRVFGVFADRNIFIATSLRYRDDLDKFSNPEWGYEIKKTVHSFNELFRGYGHKKSTNAHKLFDGAIDEKYYDD